LADFLPNWDISRGFFYTYRILFAGRISEAAMGGAGLGGYNMVNMTITELRTALSRIFFPKLEFPRDFLYIILISPKGTAKLRWRGAGERL
jgi:hypothetical protein